jgi:hypothetical protein
MVLPESAAAVHTVLEPSSRRTVNTARLPQLIGIAHTIATYYRNTLYSIEDPSRGAVVWKHSKDLAVSSCLLDPPEPRLARACLFKLGLFLTRHLIRSQQPGLGQPRAYCSPPLHQHGWRSIGRFKADAHRTRNTQLDDVLRT